MATTAPEIKVFAEFPPDAAHLEPSSGWTWVHCLTFPLDTLNKLQFTPKLYKWIRYATGVVVGVQGDLSFSCDPPHTVLEYNNDLPFESANLYYHTNDNEKRNIFPVDPDIGRITVTSSDVTSRRASFISGVAERDDRVCVLTGYERVLCDAVHLVAHCKGDQYIETYTQHRSRDTARNDIVREINDARNGILLNKFAHTCLGSTVAFLMTPNFAMSTADVDPTTPPTEKRCTAHLFDPDKPYHFGDSALRSGSLVRMPDTADNWPPDILFDAVYADAVLRHFAPRTIQDTLRQWKSIFYPGGITNAKQANYQAILDERTADAEKKNEHDQAREERAARRANRDRRTGDGLDHFDWLLIMPFLIIPPDEREEAWRKAAEMRAERERSHLEDKVVGWARGVANACP